MRNVWRSVLVVLVLSSVVAFGQTPSTGTTAPKDKALDLPLERIDAVAREMAAKKVITQRLLGADNFSLNVRHIEGSEAPLQHEKIGDVWIVREGSGIAVTGGTLIDAKATGTAGDMTGSGIRGGVERVVKAGDVVFIPPGLPHGIKESKSITYLNVRLEP